jgi:hypothetical protein
MQGYLTQSSIEEYRHKFDNKEVRVKTDIGIRPMKICFGYGENSSVLYSGEFLDEKGGCSIFIKESDIIETMK